MAARMTRRRIPLQLVVLEAAHPYDHSKTSPITAPNSISVLGSILGTAVCMVVLQRGLEPLIPPEKATTMNAPTEKNSTSATSTGSS